MTMNLELELDYDLALERIAGDLTDQQKELLGELYRASDSGVAAGLLAPVLGLSHHAPLNASIARIGKALAAAVNVEAPRRRDGSFRWWAVVATDRKSPDGRFFWVLRAPLRAALGKSGLVPREGAIFPEVVESTGNSAEPMIEGSVIRVATNVYERSAAARRRCIEHFGSVCSVCAIDFGAFYGPIAEGVIHVHHLTPLSVAGGVNYVIDPVRDLRPVCPNCHVVIHRRDPPLSIDEARALVSDSGEPRRAAQQGDAADGAARRS
jgi:predicted HNH restriction endonuclease